MRRTPKRLNELVENAHAKAHRQTKSELQDLQLRFAALETEHRALSMEHKAAKRELSVHQKIQKKREAGLKKARETRSKNAQAKKKS